MAAEFAAFKMLLSAEEHTWRRRIGRRIDSLPQRRLGSREDRSALDTHETPACAGVTLELMTGILFKMGSRIDRIKEMLREHWLTYSMYIVFPISLAAFFVALYYMLHDVM